MYHPQHTLQSNWDTARNKLTSQIFTCTYVCIQVFTLFQQTTFTFLEIQCKGSFQQSLTQKVKSLFNLTDRNTHTSQIVYYTCSQVFTQAQFQRTAFTFLEIQCKGPVQQKSLTYKVYLTSPIETTLQPRPAPFVQTVFNNIFDFNSIRFSQYVGMRHFHR